MQTNLDQYLKNYAQTWTNLGARPQAPGSNLVAQQPGAGPRLPPMAVPGSPAAGLPDPRVMTAAPAGGPAAAPPAAPAPGPVGGPRSSMGPLQDMPNGDQSFEGLFKQQPEEDQNRQIDELEQQVGDINRAYNEMSKQLGSRPDTKLSRKEKGMLLMEFGLQLMSQSSGSAHGGDIGGAVGDAGLSTLQSYRQQKNQKRADAKQWDTDQANLRAGRAKEIAGATKEYRAGEREERRIEAAEQSNLNAGRRMDQQDRRLDQQEEEIGLRERGVGGYGRSGSGTSGNDPARVATIKFLEGRGVPFEVAVRITGAAAQNPDPRRTYSDAYDDARRRYSTEEQAKAEAQMIVDLLYGPGAIEKRNNPVVPEPNVTRRNSKSGRPMVSKDGGKTWDYED